MNKITSALRCQKIELKDDRLILYKKRRFIGFEAIPIKFEQIHSVQTHQTQSGYEIVIDTHDGFRTSVDANSETESVKISEAISEAVSHKVDSSLKDDRMEFAQIPIQVALLSEAGQIAIPKIVDFLLKQAVYHRASDVHFEPWFDRLKIRYRIDGFFQDAAEVRVELKERIIARIKVLAQLVTYRNDIPQEGRISLTVDKRDLNFRVSIVPTVSGEKVVIRILDEIQTILSLGDLGFSQDTLSQFESLVLRQQGVILLTGPSSSGKTTTMYAALKMLHEIRKGSINIVSIEDPVEYEIGILTQLEVDQQKGMSFADSLKAVLRQDPEVIMIGEIRDLETAEIAIRSGLTGHLVLSTVHSGMSAGVFNRLLDMGAEPFLVASSVSGVLAQRLVRKSCEHCQISYRPDVAILEKLDFPKTLIDYDFKRGEGCERCLMSGYRGRTAISELLLVKDSIKELILSRAPTGIIETEAKSLGMRTLREDGIQKVIQGITTIEELARIL